MKRTRRRGAVGDALPQASASGTEPLDPDLLVLEGLLTYRLTRLVDVLVRAGQVYKAEYGVTLTELRILATVGAQGPLSVNQISRLTGIDKAWVSRTLAALVARDLVTRKCHATDSRLVLLSLTSEGRDMVRRIVPLAAARNEKFLAGISLKRREILDGLIAELHTRAEQLLQEGR